MLQDLFLMRFADHFLSLAGLNWPEFNDAPFIDQFYVEIGKMLFAKLSGNSNSECTSSFSDDIYQQLLAWSPMGNACCRVALLSERSHTIDFKLLFSEQKANFLQPLIKTIDEVILEKGTINLIIEIKTTFAAKVNFDFNMPIIENLNLLQKDFNASIHLATIFLKRLYQDQLISIQELEANTVKLNTAWNHPTCKRAVTKKLNFTLYHDIDSNENYNEIIKICLELYYYLLSSRTIANTGQTKKLLNNPIVQQVTNITQIINSLKGTLLGIGKINSPLCQSTFYVMMQLFLIHMEIFLNTDISSSFPDLPKNTTPNLLLKHIQQAITSTRAPTTNSQSLFQSYQPNKNKESKRTLKKTLSL